MYFQKHSLNTRISIHSKVLLTDSIFETGAKVTVGMFTNYRLQIFILAMSQMLIQTVMGTPTKGSMSEYLFEIRGWS